MNTELSASILSALPMPAILIANTARVAAMNRGAQELFGAAGLGRHFGTIVRQPALLDCIETSLRSGRKGQTRYLDTSATKESRFRVVVAPVSGETGQGVLVSFEDVTALERAGQMRRDFVANVSHELKTPLTTLLGFIETLRGAARDDAEARDRFLTIMEREAQRMNRLVSDLLSLSRVEADERVRPTSRIDIDAVLNSTVSALKPLAEAKGVTIVQTVSGDGHEKDAFIPGDADQLQQVFTNLLENAIKYSPEHETVTIARSWSERDVSLRGPAVQIDVIDRGEGIDPMHIPRLTERFYRVDSHRSREMGGTGLGLAIAKHIVNRHRGRFKIESDLGKGSKFSVLLPAR